MTRFKKWTAKAALPILLALTGAATNTACPDYGVPYDPGDDDTATDDDTGDDDSAGDDDTGDSSD